MSTDQHMSGNIEHLLLDYHLDQLDPVERDRVERVLSDDAAVRAESERVAALLRPLAAWTAPPAPKDLVQSVMDRVESHEYTIAFDPSRSRQPSGDQMGLFRSLVSLREVLAVAASIMIIVGVFVPSYYGVRQRNQGAASNTTMGMWGQGVTNYAADNGGDKPFLGARQGASWLPAGSQDNGSPVQVSYPYRVIIRISPQQMTCPNQPQDDVTLPQEMNNPNVPQSPNQVS